MEQTSQDLPVVQHGRLSVFPVSPQSASPAGQPEAREPIPSLGDNGLLLYSYGGTEIRQSRLMAPAFHPPLRKQGLSSPFPVKHFDVRKNGLLGLLKRLVRMPIGPFPFERANKALHGSRLTSNCPCDSC